MEKKISIKICNCSNCVFNGAMEIAEAIESMSDLSGDTFKMPEVEIESVALGVHKVEAPVVQIEGEEITGARTETVMSKLIELATEE